MKRIITIILCTVILLVPLSACTSNAATFGRQTISRNGIKQITEIIKKSLSGKYSDILKKINFGNDDTYSDNSKNDKSCEVTKPEESAKEPVQEPAKEPAQEPAKQPAQEPAKQPAQEPAKEPAQEPAKPSNPTNEGNSNNTGYTVSDYEKQVVTLVNEIRAKNGLSQLTINTNLSKVARIKSQDMHDKNYFDHNSPTYGSPFNMMKSFGITYRSAGENIAKGYSTPEAVVNAWMNSEGHRANILNSSFTQIGVGYVAEGNYWSQEFIG